MKQILFPKSQRGTFKYWFHHWYAFNKVALSIHSWKPKYIFHDIEKPFLKLFFPYEKVQQFHRVHNKHHLEYRHKDKIDWTALVIDWESSRLTKIESWRTCIQECTHLFMDGAIDYNTYYNIFTTARRLGFER